ncbi:MAG TPA: hypothetical protein VHX17_09510 [Candidatus Cybelea sp.]|jgi:hypothetical protein|nr:hypothetical protein [Candidatus Cybelea sp.]
MPKLNAALKAACENFLLDLIAKGAAGRLKAAEAQAAAALMEACRAYSELAERVDAIAAARELISKAEQIRVEGQEQAERVLTELRKRAAKPSRRRSASK